jgi:hypothetical protein
MTYPEPRYFGESGEVSATYRPASHEPEVPPGGIHGFRNESGEPASMLLHFAPGAPREGYFEGLAKFAVSGQPSDAEMAEFYLRHDNTWL